MKRERNCDVGRIKDMGRNMGEEKKQDEGTKRIRKG
jgi:hypothetical protein